jgi:polysaccharide export outer membrane protein
MGAVNRAGVFDAPYPMSPLAAISLAGGFTGKARRSQILIIHPEPDGSVLTRDINLDDVLDAENLSGLGVTVYPHDLVFVPTSRIANVNAFVEQYIRGMMPIDVGAGFGWNLAK